jgi:hypothetical protein
MADTLPTVICPGLPANDDTGRHRVRAERSAPDQLPLRKVRGANGQAVLDRQWQGARKRDPCSARLTAPVREATPLEHRFR